MRKIRVTLQGDSPLLMNNPASMRGQPKLKKSIPAPDEEAASKRYLMPDGKTLAVPADAVHRCLLDASRHFRLRPKEPLWPYIAGSIAVEPELISLKTTKYEVDVRRVVVDRHGIMRARPKIWLWVLAFELHYDETVLTPEFMAGPFREEVMLRAGKAKGLLDYRPAKGGDSGGFL